jgi:hypothetical protein
MLADVLLDLSGGGSAHRGSATFLLRPPNQRVAIVFISNNKYPSLDEPAMKCCIVYRCAFDMHKISLSIRFEF